MRVSPRMIFGGLAVVSLGLLGAGLVLGEWFRLQPCYWCNFQRLIYLVLAFVGLCGVLKPAWAKSWSLLAAAVAAGGVLSAGKQSWMQFAPEEAIECGFGDPTLVERVVDWLGNVWPSMFMVTGLCKEKDWVFLGLSLANWSALCFLSLAVFFVWFHRATRADGLRSR